MAEYNKPLPLISEPESARFWEGTKKHELWAHRCRQCGKYQWPPRPMCRHCQSIDIEWTRVSGEGKIYTYTTAHRVAHPGFAADAPYGIIIVDLKEGVRMLGNSVGISSDKLRIGMPMKAVFNDVTDDVTLVNWTPA